ncbi:MAG: Re/Si-specific NAD(P)(+) transhydrogenase subunit alpha [Deltaproteobacteria bacterium]|nr:Re/Si-specific NAD(P)(+) transhydrogenase subunit alpha [Deltaproteobacteria bacterium]
MKLGVPREVYPGERRVAATPDTVRQLVAMGFEVSVEAGAGAGARMADADYAAAGATVVDGAREIWEHSDLVLKVREPQAHPALGVHEADLLREGGRLISFLWPATQVDLVERLRSRRATVLAMDQVPRITRAQSMDALSSMANIAGYRAVVEAASRFGRFFTGQMTAAGKLPPARVLVIGAGVAGLQAIATARAMGAVVRAFDTRPAVREQVQSLGGECLEVPVVEEGEGKGGYAKEMSAAFIEAEMALFRAEAPSLDIVITTALVPGKRAPLLWTRDMVEAMRPGSVVVDLAAEQGGNCELTQPGEVAEHAGVQVVGYTDMVSRAATTASQLYAQNVLNLVELLGGGEGFHIDLTDEIVRGAIVLHEGEVLWPPPPKPVPPPAPAKPAAVAEAPGPVASATAAAPVAGKAHGGAERSASSAPARGGSGWWVAIAMAALWVALRTYAGTLPASQALADFLQHLTVFVLACFVGWQVIWNVTAALHTPLMSVTNAISGIIILGGMLHASHGLGSPDALLGAAAVFFAAINVAGGFLVTQRMLRMFRR